MNYRAKLTQDTKIFARTGLTTITTIEDIPDVNVANGVNGATLVYNSNTNKYDVTPLDATYIIGTIDGGTF
jgi:hypothetical protein